MSKFKEKDQLEYYLHDTLLGEIPLFFSKSIANNIEDTDPKRYITIAAFNTDRQQPYPYHKVISKIF